MAKDLPYFKFFVSEWNDGDITLEDYKTQGVFINICSYYWSKECNLTDKLLKKRFKDSLSDIDILISEKLIKVLDGFISIRFLDEQQNEREEQSKIRSKGGKASAEARRLKKLEQETNTTSTEAQHVLKSSSTETQLLRKDKIRKDKIIDIDVVKKFLNWFNGQKEIYTGKKGSFKGLSKTDEGNLKKLTKDYDGKDFEKAIPALFANQWAKDTNNLTPTHFLRVDNFNKYLDSNITIKPAAKTGGLYD